MRIKKILLISINSVLITALYLAFNVSHADPVESFETQKEAEEFVSKVEGQMVFEGWAEGGNIEYIRRAKIVPLKEVFLIQLETVFLLNVRPDVNGKLKALSACGVGHSFGLDSLDGIYLVGEGGTSINAIDGSDNNYLSEDTHQAAKDCYNRLFAIHANKNLSEIEISNASGQMINLSWFGNERHVYYSYTDRQFNIWESSKVSIKETDKSETPVTVEVQRISKMACDDGGPPHVVEDWKRGVTPWIPLEEQSEGVFAYKNIESATFPDYDKSELGKLIAERTGWNTQYVSCAPMDLGPTYRFKREGKTLFEIHIPEVW